MVHLDNDERKAAIERAIEDGAIPTDEPIWSIIISYHCPECNQKQPYPGEFGTWSHLGHAREEAPAEVECWYCGNTRLARDILASKWDAPLDRPPPGAIPEEYHSD